MEWFRWYHGAASDPKWPIIARKSGQNIGTVVSVWVALLEYASQGDERGSIIGFDCETVDALFGYPDGTTETVCNTMRNKGLIDHSERIVSWSKRQPQRERDDSSTERVRRFREKQKSNKSDAIQGGNTSETPGNTSVAQETPRTEQNRTEKNRTEKKEKDIAPAGTKKPKLPSAYSEAFEAFWSLYPSRNGQKTKKAKAWEVFWKLTSNGSGISPELLVDRIRILAPTYGDFPRDAVTWLNQRGWEDEVGPIRLKPVTQGQARPNKAQALQDQNVAAMNEWLASKGVQE